MSNVRSASFPSIPNVQEVISRFSEALLADGDVTIDARGWPVLDMAAMSIVLGTFNAARKQGTRLTLMLPEQGGLRESLTRCGLTEQHLSIDENGGWTGLKTHPGPLEPSPSEADA